MNEPASFSDRIALAFVEKYWSDKESGADHDLPHYLGLYPGHEDRIAEEYLALQSQSDLAGDDAEREVAGYRLIEELGRGGQAVVYLAEGGALNRRVALKILRGLGPASEYLMRRFQREAQVMSKINHPGICPVFDAGVERGVAYIAMQYIEGETLDQHIASLSDSKDTRALAAMFESVARALHAAHERGVIHRDIKPSNIMLPRTSRSSDSDSDSPQGVQPVLLDFGLAGDDSDPGATLTRSGDRMGTPAYMSPEQIQHGGTHLDARTDLYSLGVTMYECLTGQRPYQYPTPLETERAVLQGQYSAVRRASPSVPRDLEIIVEVAMERDRSRRYPSALDLAEDLRRFQSSQSIRARPISRSLRVRRWVGRNPTMTAILVLVIAALAVTFGLLNKVSEEKAIAEDALRVTHLIEASTEADEIDPTLSLLLAREAVRIQDSPTTRGRLLEALALRHPLDVFRLPVDPTDPVVHWPNASWYQCQISLDGGRVATAVAHNPRFTMAVLVAVWEQGRADPLLVVNARHLAVQAGQDIDSGGIHGWSMDEAGKHLLMHTWNGELRSYRLDAEQPAETPRIETGITHLERTGDGRVIVLRTDGSVDLLKPDGTVERALITAAAAHPPITALSSGAEGEFAVAFADGSLLALQLDENETVELQAPSSWVDGSRWTDLDIAGNHVAAWGGAPPTEEEAEPRAWLCSWDLQDTGVPREHDAVVAPANRTWSLELSADGERLLTTHQLSEEDFGKGEAGRSGTSALAGIRDRVALWTLRSPQPPQVVALPGPSSQTGLLWHGSTWPRALGVPSLWSPSGDRFYTIQGEHRFPNGVYVWSPEGRPLFSRDGEWQIFRAEFTPDGSLLLSEPHGLMRLLDRSGSQRAMYAGNQNVVWDVAFAERVHRFASACHDGSIRLWSDRDRSLERHITGQTMGIIGGFASDGEHIVTLHVADSVGGMRLTKGRDSRIVGPRWAPMPRQIWDFDLSSDGKNAALVVLSPTSQEPPQLIDLETETFRRIPIAAPEAEVPPVCGVALLPDGQRVALVRMDGSGWIQSLDSAETRAGWSAPIDPRSIDSSVDGCQSLCEASPDGSAILTGHISGICRLWSSDTGKLIGELPGPGGQSHRGVDNYVSSASFSPEGRWIAVGYASGSVWLFDAKDPQVKAQLGGHRDQVFGVAFSPSGSRLASISRGGTMRVSDIESQETVVFLRPHVPITGGVFWLSDQRLLTHTQDGTLREWPLDDETIFALADERAFRELTTDERLRHAEALGTTDEP